MAYYILNAGGSLYKVTTAGVATALTLPANVTIDSTKPARMAVIGRFVVIANAPSRGLFVDTDFNVRPMGLIPPASAPVLSTGASGGLTGTFRGAYTYKVKDSDGNLLAESPMSPVSAQLAIAAKLLTMGYDISPDSAVTHIGLYRTINNGGSDALFPWIDVESNLLTSFSDDLSDTLLADITAPTELGAPPGTVAGTALTILVEWKGRLWGVGNLDVDDLRFSGAGLLYAWPDDYLLEISPVGADQYGITGIIPRRDELGICKRNIIWKIVGEDPDSFEPVKVVEGKGVFATDSIRVIRDIGYFLAEDGVYTWGPTGVSCVSDDKVRPWFTTDSYFNRALFSSAFAKYNARYHSYELHLAAAGSSSIDRWVSYDITSGEWFGPHKTDEFTPTGAGEIVDANGIAIPVILSSGGFVYQQNQSTFADGASAIAMSAITKAHSGDTPDITKLFKELAVINKAESTSGSLQIGVGLGKTDQATSKSLTADLMDPRQRFPTLGPGRNVRLEFAESTLNQGCEIYGYEIPFHELGRR